MWRPSGLYSKEYNKVFKRDIPDIYSQICLSCGYPNGYHYGEYCPNSEKKYPLVLIDGYRPEKVVFMFNLKII